MTKLGLVAVVVVVLVAVPVLAAQAGAAAQSGAGAAPAPVQVAQVPPGAPGGGVAGQVSEADRARFREQMVERMLQQANLTGDEANAARKALMAKEEARQALTQELAKLRAMATQPNPSSQELEKALAVYRAALVQFRKKVEAEDAALAKQLSLASQVRCLALGILDNGLGAMGMGGRTGMGRPAAGGAAGGRGTRRPSE